MSEESYLNREPMLEMFIFETLQLLEQLEQILLNGDKNNSSLCGDQINAVFKIMHTIKCSSAMMMFKGISTLMHSLEELFYFLRENNLVLVDFSRVCDLVLTAVDTVKRDIAQIEEGIIPENGHEKFSEEINSYLSTLSGNVGGTFEQKKSWEIGLKEREIFYISSYGSSIERAEQRYIIRIFFVDGCLMENIRAYTIIHNLKELCQELYYRPKDIIAENDSAEYIRKNGFTIYLSTSSNEGVLRERIQEALFLKSYELTHVEGYEEDIRDLLDDIDLLGREVDANLSESVGVQQGFVNVSLENFDKLMDLATEIVVELQSEGLNEASSQLRKLTNNLQDIIMAMKGAMNYENTNCRR